MQENHLDVHILAILVQKILQEMRHGLVRYVSADDDVSDGFNYRGVIQYNSEAVIDHVHRGENAMKRKRKIEY